MGEKKGAALLLVRGERYDRGEQQFAVARAFRSTIIRRFGRDKWVDIVLQSFETLLKGVSTVDAKLRRVWCFGVGMEYEITWELQLRERMFGPKHARRFVPVLSLRPREKPTTDAKAAEMPESKPEDDGKRASGDGPPTTSYQWN